MLHAAKTNRSLLIVTWDEDDNSNANQIPTIFVGPMVKAGKYSENVNHDNVLRTLESLYNLAPVGSSAKSGTYHGYLAIGTSIGAPARTRTSCLTNYNYVPPCPISHQHILSLQFCRRRSYSY